MERRSFIGCLLSSVLAPLAGVTSVGKLFGWYKPLVESQAVSYVISWADYDPERGSPIVTEVAFKPEQIASFIVRYAPEIRVGYGYSNKILLDGRNISNLHIRYLRTGKDGYVNHCPLDGNGYRVEFCGDEMHLVTETLRGHVVWQNLETGVILG